MTDEELIKQTKKGLEKYNISYGAFWRVWRAKGFFATVWFWAANEDDPNPSCQFDEERGTMLWCH